MDKQSFLKEALRLADLGFKIFPMCKDRKQPILSTPKVDGEKAGGFYSTSNKKEIIELWQRYPFANIGIATGNFNEYGSGVVVIDLDRHGSDGVNNLLQWEKIENVRINRDTWAVGTGGGGYHLYYKTDLSIPKSTGVVLKGVDIMADRASVVAPPSIFPKGRRYHWIKGHLPNDTELAELSVNELKLINRAKTRSTYNGNYTSSVFDDIESDGTISEGRRNSAIFRLACKLVHNKRLSEATIRDKIYIYNLQHCKPQLSNEEVNRILTSAFHYR